MKNLNPFSLDRKLRGKTKHEMIYMFWRECMPTEYYRFICEEKHFLYLNGKNVFQPKLLQIIADFTEKDEKTISCCRIILLGTRIFFSMSIQTCIQKFSTLPKTEALI